MRTAKENFERLMKSPTYFLPLDFTNGVGQKVDFLEDPDYGEDYPLWVVFPEFKMAFLSDFYDTEDMTAKVGDLFTPEQCERNNWRADQDLDYVPILAYDKMYCNFEL
tara:strand:- start:1252 stop:1575 length:324 start_codon:yes stop_codon:yes gene_type:complete